MTNTSTLTIPTESRKAWAKKPPLEEQAVDPRVSLAYLGRLYDLQPRMVRRYLSREDAPKPILIGPRVIRYRLSEATAYLDSQLAPK